MWAWTVRLGTLHSAKRWRVVDEDPIPADEHDLPDASLARTTPGEKPIWWPEDKEWCRGRKSRNPRHQHPLWTHPNLWAAAWPHIQLLNQEWAIKLKMALYEACDSPNAACDKVFERDCPPPRPGAESLGSDLFQHSLLLGLLLLSHFCGMIGRHAASWPQKACSWRVEERESERERESRGERE